VSGKKKINAKSIISVLSAGIQKNTILNLEVKGEDEEAALEALSSLLKSPE